MWVKPWGDCSRSNSGTPGPVKETSNLLEREREHRPCWPDIHHKHSQGALLLLPSSSASSMPSWKQDFHKLQTPKIISYYELTDSHAVQGLLRERKLKSAKIGRTQKQMAEKTTSPSKKTTFILQILQTMARKPPHLHHKVVRYSFKKTKKLGHKKINLAEILLPPRAVQQLIASAHENRWTHKKKHPKWSKNRKDKKYFRVSREEKRRKTNLDCETS